MAARCEAAGRPNNEDNYQLDDNLSDNSWGFTADAEVSLGEKGALLVVCDGMGGMNAGEVASDIAVKTIKEWFTTEKLTDATIAAPCKYIASAIVAADAAIKAHSKTNPDTEGMGSTIVLAWLLGQKVYVGWCGDSRCYRFNPALGLERLSHDHSYVQELVDAGKLTEELAFDHPNNNIITRSLGDPRGAAQPDTKEFDLYDQDIILLCSDGLCGTLRDNEMADST
jgi:serine/threonine protein phosphatase PrpC